MPDLHSACSFNGDEYVLKEMSSCTVNEWRQRVVAVVAQVVLLLPSARVYLCQLCRIMVCDHDLYPLFACSRCAGQHVAVQGFSLEGSDAGDAFVRVTRIARHPPPHNSSEDICDGQGILPAIL